MREKQIFYLLSALCSLWPKLDSPEDPYDSMISSAYGRSPIVSDFDESHLVFLEAILADIHDPELQARVADVLWLRKRKYPYAETAVNGLLASAKSLDTSPRLLSVADRIERAAQIAIRVGPKNKPFLAVIAYIEEALVSPDEGNAFYEKSRLMRILQENRAGDFAKYAGISEKLALLAEGIGDSETANIYWTLQAKWHLFNKDEDAARQAQIKAAETYVLQAERHANGDMSGYLVASHFMKQAFESMRRIAGMNARAEELHTKLLEYQEKSLLAFSPISVSVPIEDMSRIGVDQVTGKSLNEALLIFASFCSSHPKHKLKEQVIKQRKDFVLHRIIPRIFVNAMGHVIARQPENEEEAILADMFHNASLTRSIDVAAVIEPARQQIISEHYVRLADFYPFVLNNPFIRSGREVIVAHGLYAGMTGDILTAVHLLIPQIEDSLRFILYQLGVITSNLDADGIQEDFDTNKMLKISKFSEPLEKAFGEDLIFDLRGLLVERFGANLRNDIAHGLIDYNTFHAPATTYFWWLAWRFYALPVLRDIDTEQATESKPD